MVPQGPNSTSQPDAVLPLPRVLYKQFEIGIKAKRIVILKFTKVYIHESLTCYTGTKQFTDLYYGLENN